MSSLLGLIKKTTEEKLGVNMWVKKGLKGKDHVTNAKKIYVHIAREITGLPLSKIGNRINRGHADVLHLKRKADEHLLLEKDFNLMYNEVLEAIPQDLPTYKKLAIKDLKQEREMMLKKAKEITQRINQIKKLK